MFYWDGNNFLESSSMRSPWEDLDSWSAADSAVAAHSLLPPELRLQQVSSPDYLRAPRAEFAARSRSVVREAAAGGGDETDAAKSGSNHTETPPRSPTYRNEWLLPDEDASLQPPHPSFEPPGLSEQQFEHIKHLMLAVDDGEGSTSSRHEAGAARGREHTAEALSWHGASPLTTRLAQSAAVGVERGSSCAEAAADLAGAEARQAGAAAAAAAAEAGVARRSGGARSSSNDSEISSEMAELDLPVRFSQFGIAQSCTKDRSTAPSGARPPARRAGPGPPPAGPARPPSMPIGGGQSNMGTGSRP